MSEPSTTWRETITDGEEARLEALAQRITALQRQRDAGKTVGRGLHVKQHAGARATLEIAKDLPSTHRHGVFAKAGPQRAFVRFSNGSAKDQHDKQPDLRGLAVKILDVEGDKVLGDARTQDFLFVDEDALPFRSPEEFVHVLEAAQNVATLPFTLIGRLGLRAFGLLGGLAKLKGNRGSVLDLAYHSVAPFCVGPYAARLHLEPLHQPSPHARAMPEPDYLRTEATTRVAAGGLSYAVLLQLAAVSTDSVEDVSRPWTSPVVRAGKLTLHASDPRTPEGQRLDEAVRGMSFDPWHALVAHRPLGLSMRARKPAYFQSTRARSATAEPDVALWESFGAA